MADVVYRDPDQGPNTMLGIILGIVIVVALLVGAWLLFFRQPVAVEQPDTTIIEQPQPQQQQQQQPDVNVQPAPEGDTNINVNPGGETSPTP